MYVVAAFLDGFRDCSLFKCQGGGGGLKSRGGGSCEFPRG